VENKNVIFSLFVDFGRLENMEKTLGNTRNWRFNLGNKGI